MRQARSEPHLGRSFTPNSLGSQFSQTAFGTQLGRGIPLREIDTQVRDRKQRLQMQRALHLLRESTSSDLAVTSFGQITHLPWLPARKFAYRTRYLMSRTASPGSCSLRVTKNGWSSDLEHGHCYQQCTVCVTAADSSLTREGMWICCNDVLTSSNISLPFCTSLICWVDVNLSDCVLLNSLGFCDWCSHWLGWVPCLSAHR